MIDVHLISNEELEKIEEDFKKVITGSFKKDYNIGVLLFVLVSILALFSATGMRLKQPEKLNNAYGDDWKEIMIKINSQIMDKLRKKENSLSVNDVVSAFFDYARANYIFIQSEYFKPQQKH